MNNLRKEYQEKTGVDIDFLIPTETNVDTCQYIEWLEKKLEQPKGVDEAMDKQRSKMANSSMNILGVSDASFKAGINFALSQTPSKAEKEGER